MNSEPLSGPHQWATFAEGDAEVFEIFQADATSVFRRIDFGSGQYAMSELFIGALFLVAMMGKSGGEFVFRSVKHAMALLFVLGLILFNQAVIYWIERTSAGGSRFVTTPSTSIVTTADVREDLRFCDSLTPPFKGMRLTNLHSILDEPRRSGVASDRAIYASDTRGTTNSSAGHLSQDEIEDVYTAICNALRRPPDIRHAKINWEWVFALAMGLGELCRHPMHRRDDYFRLT